MKDLVELGHLPKGNKVALQEMSVRNNIDLSLWEPKVKEGWMGKAKGSKQILYERHMIDVDNIDLYSVKGPNLKRRTSIRSSHCKII